MNSISGSYSVNQELDGDVFVFNDIGNNIPLRKRGVEVVSDCSNGKIYKGFLKKGKPNGKGMEADLFNGTVSIGIWKDGHLISLEKLVRTRCAGLWLK